MARRVCPVAATSACSKRHADEDERLGKEMITNTEDGSCVPWAELIDDVFEAVLGQLDLRDVAPLRVVCSAWKGKAHRLLYKFETSIQHAAWHGAPLPFVIRLFPALDRIKVTVRGATCWLNSVSCLTELSRLTALELKNSSVRAGGLPAFDLGILTGCRKLCRLTLYQCCWTPGMGLQQLTNLKELTLRRCSIDAWEPGLGRILRPLRKLKRLEIDGYLFGARVNLHGISCLQSLAALVLHLPFSTSPNDAVRELARIPGLTSLVLSVADCRTFSSMEPVELERLAALTDLEELKLKGRLAVSHIGLETLSTLMKLKVLHMATPPRDSDLGLGVHVPLTEIVLSYLPQLKQLTSLGVPQSRVNSSLLSSIVDRLSSLQTLDLSGCQLVGDTALFTLARLSSLMALNISHCIQVTDLGIAALAKSGAPLTLLDLTGCYLHITDISMGELSKLGQLRWLSLAFCEHITDLGLGLLAPGTPFLGYLSLHGCLRNITDAGITTLAANLTCLKELDVAFCYFVSDISVQGLNRMPNLKHINIVGTQLASGAWQEINPNIDIVLNNDGWWMST